MRIAHYRTWSLVRTKNHEKLETHTIVLGLSREYRKTWKMRRKHYRIWSMVKKLKIMEYENKHSMKWNMASNTEQSGK